MTLKPRATCELDLAINEIKSGDVETFDSIEGWEKAILKYVRLN